MGDCFMFQLMSWSWHPLVSGPRRLQLKLPQDVVVSVVGVVAVVAVVDAVVVVVGKTRIRKKEEAKQV